MMVLPIVFLPVISRFPTGLVLYWMTTNLWTVGQGLVTRQLVPKPAPPEKRTSRTPPKPRDDGSAGDGARREAPKPPPSGQPRIVRRKKKKARR